MNIEETLHRYHYEVIPLVILSMICLRLAVTEGVYKALIEYDKYQFRKKNPERWPDPS